MTPTRRMFLALVAISVLLAFLVTLFAGVWAPRAEASKPVAALPSVGAPTSEPAYSGAVGTVLIGGWASWYDNGRGLYAAAGPLLREALGSKWRGQYVTVEGNGRSVEVRLTDHCACGLRHDKPTFLDLSRDAFAQLADPSVGILAVSIEIGLPPDPRDDAMRDEVRDMTLPATDVE